MNTIPMKAEKLSELPYCWLYSNREYLLHSPLSNSQDRLPVLSKSYESVLEDLGIAYRESTGSLLEYWDPSSYCEVEETLPVYIYLPDETYKFVKYYTGKVPTESSIKAAQILVKKVDVAVNKYDMQMNQVPELKDLLHGRKAVGFYNRKYNEIIDFIIEEEYLKVIPVFKIYNDWYTDDYKIVTGYCAVFDVNQIELDSKINLEVPKGKKGLFIGKGGWQVKEWCKRLGLKRINVVEI